MRPAKDMMFSFAFDIVTLLSASGALCLPIDISLYSEARFLISVMLSEFVQLGALCFWPRLSPSVPVVTPETQIALTF